MTYSHSVWLSYKKSVQVHIPSQDWYEGPYVGTQGQAFCVKTETLLATKKHMYGCQHTSV